MLRRWGAVGTAGYQVAQVGASATVQGGFRREAQSGPDMVQDMTPGNASAQELRPFVMTTGTGGGTSFGGLSLSRDEGGRIVRRPVRVGKVQIAHEYVYDNAARLAAVFRDGTPTEVYTYGLQGERRTDAKGRTYAYDDALRLVEVRVGAGASGQMNVYGQVNGRGIMQPEDDVAEPLIRLAYDAHGNIAVRSDAGGVTRYAYTPQGQLAAVLLPDGTRVEYACTLKGCAVPSG